MSRKGRSFIILVLLVLIVAYLAVRQYTRPEFIKTKLISLTRDKIGRDLTIAGDIDVTLLPEGVIGARQISLNTNGSAATPPLLNLDRSRISIDPLSLLTKAIKINRVDLHGLTLRLTTEKDGSNNWHDLLTLTPKEGAAVLHKIGGSRPAEFSFARADAILLENARIIWQDQRNNSHIELSDLFLKVNNAAFGQPAAIELSANVGGKTLAHPGAIKWQSVVVLDKNREQLQLSENRLQLFGFLPDTKPERLTMTVNVPQARLDIDQQKLEIPELTLALDQIKLHADTLKLTNFSEKASVQAKVNLDEFNPANVAKQWRIAIPALRNPKSLQKLAMHFQLALVDNTLSLNALHAKLDNTSISGKVSAKIQPMPEIGFDLLADGLKLDDYLASPQNSTSRLTTQGFTIHIPDPPDDKMYAWHVNGQLRVGSLSFKGMQASDARLAITSSERAQP